MSNVIQATPNVNITNPQIRRVVRLILDSFGGLIFVVGAVDAASGAFDLGWLLIPAGAGYIAARTIFGFAVDTPNTPTKADIVPVLDAVVVDSSVDPLDSVRGAYG